MCIRDSHSILREGGIAHIDSPRDDRGYDDGVHVLHENAHVRSHRNRGGDGAHVRVHHENDYARNHKSHHVHERMAAILFLICCSF